MLLLLQGAWHGKGPLEAYEMANYWDTKFKMNTFGLSIVEVSGAFVQSAGASFSVHALACSAGADTLSLCAQMRDRSSLEVVPLVDLPAFASFTLTQERPTAQKATSSSMRRLLNV